MPRTEHRTLNVGAREIPNGRFARCVATGAAALSLLSVSGCTAYTSGLPAQRNTQRYSVDSDQKSYNEMVEESGGEKDTLPKPTDLVQEKIAALVVATCLETDDAMRGTDERAGAVKWGIYDKRSAQFDELTKGSSASGLFDKLLVKECPKVYGRPGG